MQNHRSHYSYSFAHEFECTNVTFSPHRSEVDSYMKSMQKYVDRIKMEGERMYVDLEKLPPRPLLLVPFHRKRQVPDRTKALSVLAEQALSDKYFNHTQLDHAEWLEAIMDHRFVLAPHGHGLDTHRMMEIYLMGGIPVVKNSTITSCYDDSDNGLIGEKQQRGSLPLVVVQKYEDLSREMLEREWSRIVKVPPDQWDWKRLTLQHWRERIGCGVYAGAKTSA